MASFASGAPGSAATNNQPIVADPRGAAPSPAEQAGALSGTGHPLFTQLHVSSIHVRDYAAYDAVFLLGASTADSVELDAARVFGLRIILRE